MRKLALFDRDGVINADKEYLHRIEDVEWIPGVFEIMARLKKEGYTIVVVTNQSGVARGYYSEQDVESLHQWMAEEVRKHGGEISRFYYCPHLPGAPVSAYDKECECRKPKPGMILQALREFNADAAQSFLIGDSQRDIDAAEQAGVRGILFTGGRLDECIEKEWLDIS